MNKRNRRRNRPSILLRHPQVRQLLNLSRRVRRKQRAAKTRSIPAARAQLKAGYLVVLFAVVVVVVGSLVYHLHVRFEAIQLGYETSKARAVRARLLTEQRELRLEMASLKDPKRIESEAREKLDMAVPDQRNIIPVGKRRRSVLASGGAL